MAKYKYLFWDIDGTILDFKAAEKNSIRNLFEKYELGECSDEMIARYSEINDRYWKALERGEMTKPQILVGRFKEFFEKEGINPQIAESFNEDYQISLGDTVVFCDDSYKILSEEKMDKYVLVAITNGTAVAQKRKLAKSGLDKVFDYIFISEIVGVEKPNTGFFEKVLSELNMPEKEKILIIGDSLTSDILGGVNMGIDTCWYNSGNKNNETNIKPTYTIADLRCLKDII